MSNTGTSLNEMMDRLSVSQREDVETRFGELQAECDALRADAARWRFVGDNPWRAIDILSEQCGTHPALWHKEANAAIDAARRKE